MHTVNKHRYSLQQLGKGTKTIRFCEISIFSHINNCPLWVCGEASANYFLHWLLIMTKDKGFVEKGSLGKLIDKQWKTGRSDWRNTMFHLRLYILTPEVHKCCRIDHQKIQKIGQVEFMCVCRIFFFSADFSVPRLCTPLIACMSP